MPGSNDWWRISRSTSTCCRSLAKKSLRPARLRELAHWFRDTFSVSCARACRLAQFGRRGIEQVVPRINRPCGYGFAIWPMRARGLGLYASGGSCGARAHPLPIHPPDDFIDWRDYSYACGWSARCLRRRTRGRLRPRLVLLGAGAWILYMIPCMADGGSGR